MHFLILVQFGHRLTKSVVKSTPGSTPFAPTTECEKLLLEDFLCKASDALKQIVHAEVLEGCLLKLNTEISVYYASTYRSDLSSWWARMNYRVVAPYTLISIIYTLC